VHRAVIRVGIVDSGIGGPAGAFVVERADFAAGPETQTGPRDRCGHGSRVAAIIAAAEGIELLDARVFFDSLRTGAAQAAAALDWLREREARLVNLSFGLREDRPALREACARAVAGGMLLVASAPARGAPVYPASYPGVVRATGDARCAPGELSQLATVQADFGGHVRSDDGRLAGASAGCARVCAALARYLVAYPGAGNETALAALRESAAYRGPERRTASEGAKPS
jgi:hypothetical protein